MQRIIYVICLVISLGILTVEPLEDESSDTTLVRFSDFDNLNGLSFTPNASLLCDDQLRFESNLSVYISNSGNNTLDCIHRGAVNPCLTIQHAYDQTMKQITNVTQFISFIFMDGDYNMTEMLVLNRQANLLKHIEFTSVLRTNIRAVSEEAVFWIGCNSSYKVPCISYAIEFNNLNFKEFGSEFPAVLVVFNIRFLSLHNCIFSYNNRSAINSLDTSIELINVGFSYNKGSSGFKDPKANLTAFFPISNVSTGGAVAIVFREATNKSVYVSHCNFTKNKALVNLVYPVVSNTLNSLELAYAGGGVLMQLMGNCSDINVKVVDSHFIGNNAVGGGAVAIMLSENSTRIKVTFIDCNLMHNIGSYTGGAILFVNMDYAEKNRLSIIDCKLSHNRAKYGGALKLIISKVRLMGVLHSTAPSLKIIRSQISRNTAQVGSAIFLVTDAYIVKEESVPVYIIGSQINNNNVPDDDFNETQSVLISHATIVTYKVDIRFIGNNAVERNKFGCGLYAANSNIHINGTLNVSQNVARDSGGGMTLVGSSFIVLHPGSHLIFKENVAGKTGGALVVITYYWKGESSTVYNRHCFLQYKTPNLPHSKWDVSIDTNFFCLFAT